MDEREKLQSDDMSQRISAAESLSLMGPDASFAAVELVAACADEEAVRDYAVAALEELGAPPEESLQRLAEFVSADHSLVAYWAITLLGRAGASARFSQDALVAALNTSSDSSLKERAAWALGSIGADSDSARQGLQQAASSSEARLSRIAQASLEQVKT